MKIKPAFYTLVAVPFALMTLASGGRAEGFRDEDVPMQVEEELDLSRYLGTWYEIARFPNNFEIGCEGVTAEYSALPEGRIKVVNSCLKEGLDGPIDTAEGVRNTASAAAEKLPVSAMATKVRSRSRSGLCIGNAFQIF